MALYPATLPNSLFLVDFKRFSTETIMSSANINDFVFISTVYGFSRRRGPIALPKTFNTVVSRSGEIRYCCFVPNFLLLSLMLTVDFFGRCLITGWKYSLLFLVYCDSFYQSGCWICLFNYFFCIYGDDHIVFFF